MTRTGPWFSPQSVRLVGTKRRLGPGAGVPMATDLHSPTLARCGGPFAAVRQHSWAPSTMGATPIGPIFIFGHLLACPFDLSGGTALQVSWFLRSASASPSGGKRREMRPQTIQLATWHAGKGLKL